MLVFYLLVGIGAYPPDARVYWVGFDYFLVKQLEIVKRPATFVLTQNVLTFNLPKLPFRLYKVKRLCYKKLKSHLLKTLSKITNT
jgi:hypothetical protein